MSWVSRRFKDGCAWLWLSLALLTVASSVGAVGLDVLLAIQGSVYSGGSALAWGNASFKLSTDACASFFYDSGSDFNGSIVAGQFDVMLGNASLTALTVDSTEPFFYLQEFVDGARQVWNSTGGDCLQFSNPFYLNNATIDQRIVVFNSTLPAYYNSTADGVYVYDAGGHQLSFNASAFNSTYYTQWSNTSATPGGGDSNVQYNDGGVFGGDSNFTWNKSLKQLMITGNGSYGDVLVINGSYGTTNFTGNDIRFTRPAPNYITAMHALGSLLLGAGGTQGGIYLAISTLANTIYTDSIGVGIKRTNPRVALDVAGSVNASENVTALDFCFHDGTCFNASNLTSVESTFFNYSADEYFLNLSYVNATDRNVSLNITAVNNSLWTQWNNNTYFNYTADGVYVYKTGTTFYFNASAFNATYYTQWYNGTGGSEVYNGTFNSTSGGYVYNDTDFNLTFNETKMNATIDSRTTAAGTHELLSSTHNDTQPSDVTGGDLVFGNWTPSKFTPEDCTGHAENCNSYPTEGECITQKGCFWMNPFCLGTHAECMLFNYDNQADCEGNTSCVWVPEVSVPETLYWDDLPIASAGRVLVSDGSKPSWEGAVNLSDSLTVAGATTLSSTLNVTGASRFNNAVNISSTLNVNGETTVNKTIRIRDVNYGWAYNSSIIQQKGYYLALGNEATFGYNYLAVSAFDITAKAYSVFDMTAGGDHAGSYGAGGIYLNNMGMVITLPGYYDAINRLTVNSINLSRVFEVDFEDSDAIQGDEAVVTVNENGYAGVDFAVETNADPNAIFVDGGTNRVTVGEITFDGTNNRMTPPTNKTHDIGSTSVYWDDAYLDDAWISGVASMNDRSEVLKELVAHPLYDKQPEAMDYEKELHDGTMVIEFDPRSLPLGLFEVDESNGWIGTNLGATCVYNYKVNYEQQLVIDNMTKSVIELENKVTSLEQRIKELEGLMKK